MGPEFGLDLEQVGTESVKESVAGLRNELRVDLRKH